MVFVEITIIFSGAELRSHLHGCIARFVKGGQRMMIIFKHSLDKELAIDPDLQANPHLAFLQ